MACLGYHGMVVVGTTLTHPLPWVGMYVGNYITSKLLAELPEGNVGGTLKPNITCIQGSFVEVILEHELRDLASVQSGEQEGPTFTNAPAAPSNFSNHPRPSRQCHGGEGVGFSYFHGMVSERLLENSGI